jgi:hypothetical protein
MDSIDFYELHEPVASTTAAPYHFARRLSPQLMRHGSTALSPFPATLLTRGGARPIKLAL